MNDVNPYESPPAATLPDEAPLPEVRVRPLWAGPLLTLGVLCFVLALVCSSVTVVSEGRWVVAVMTMAFLGLGVLCTGISFYMYRGARRAQKWRVGEIRRQAMHEVSKRSGQPQRGDR